MPLPGLPQCPCHSPAHPSFSPEQLSVPGKAEHIPCACRTGGRGPWVSRRRGWAELGACVQVSDRPYPLSRQVAKAVSQALNRCVNCLPGQRDVDAAIRTVSEASKRLLAESVSVTLGLGLGLGLGPSLPCSHDWQQEQPGAGSSDACS